MTEDKDPDDRHDPTELVGPFARVRAIVAVLLILVALGVLFWRMVLA